MPHAAPCPQVICWVLGEYGHLARRPPAAVLSRLLSVLTAHRMATDRVRGVLLAALAKLAAHTGGAAGPVGAELLRPHGAGGEAAEFLHKCLSSQSLELQQRAHELLALLKWVRGGGRERLHEARTRCIRKRNV